MVTVTVVVAARDEERSIGRCLDGLLSQTHPCAMIVVDGMSTDHTQEIAASRGVPVIPNPEQIASTGFNRGIEASDTEIVGIMSAHAVPALDYVERALLALEQTGAWAVGGRINRTAETPRQAAIATATSSPVGVGNARHNYSTVAEEAETVFPGMWPRWVFGRLGMFDRELGRNADDEFSDRIREAGGTIWYDPSIVVEYEPRDSLIGLFRQYHDYGFWKVRVYQKHPGAIRPRQLVPPAWVAALGIGMVGLVTDSPLKWLLAPAAGLYALVIGAESLRVGGLRLSPLVFASFVTMHAAYGLGMWQGVGRFIVDKVRGRPRLP
jgi:succinoglycan biosynthesis protein ExoA